MTSEGLSAAESASVEGWQPHVIEGIDVPVDQSEVARYMGYPASAAPNSHLAEILNEWIPIAAERSVPRAVYAAFPIVSIDKRSLSLRTPNGTTDFHGAIGEFLGGSERIVAFVASAGKELQALADELSAAGKSLEAFIVNAVGAERAEAAEQVIIDRLKDESDATGLVPTLPYAPGYCGMELTQQRPLFAMFGDQPAGVTLTEDCLMYPLKSVSGLIGLAPPELVEVYRSPCDRCERRTCDMRR